MSITAIPFAVLKMQYRLARLPLQLVDERVFGRMESDAPARLFFERSLGMLDMTVGNALHVPEFEQRGAELVERSDALRQAARLDAAATENIKAAGSNVRASREKAAQEREQAQAEEQSAAKNARAAAQNRKRAAVDSAEKRIATGKKRAEETAAQQEGAVEAAKREEEAMIRAAEQSAVAAAGAKLDDAEDKRDTAANKITRADRLEELADAEKQRRRS
jgi:hypothetical protein